MAQITTLSSLGTSTPLILNPVAKTTTVQISAASGFGSSGAGVLLQFTLDDPTTTPAPTISWATISSAIVVSTAAADTGVIFTILSPVGGLRLSSSNTVTGTITLKSLQSITN